MSESAPEAPVEPQAEVTPPEGEAKTYDEAYVKQLRAEAAKHRTEARTAAAELERVRQSSMSEAERAIAEAKVAGRTEAATEFGRDLARERFDALAGRRNPDFDTEKALEYVDLAKFLGDDGRPDPKAIAAAVERLVPEVHNGPPSFDGGPRTSAPKGGDMNHLLRQAAGRA